MVGESEVESGEGEILYHEQSEKLTEPFPGERPLRKKRKNRLQISEVPKNRVGLLSRLQGSVGEAGHAADPLSGTGGEATCLAL